MGKEEEEAEKEAEEQEAEHHPETNATNVVNMAIGKYILRYFIYDLSL